MQIVAALKKIADTKGLTLAQISIAWVSALGPHMIPIPGSSRPQRLRENLGAAEVELSAEETQAVTCAVEEIGVKGSRYNEMFNKTLWG